MGLDCSHDAFHGAYSAFNTLRQCVNEATGGSTPPHWEYGPRGGLIKHGNNPAKRKPELDDDFIYFGEGYTASDYPGLREFLIHSDCDGEISPEMCEKVADDLEKILPLVEALGWEAGGHIARGGGFVAVLQRFIAGCRAAAEANEPLIFS